MNDKINPSNQSHDPAICTGFSSASISLIAEALVKFQGLMKNVAKKSDGQVGNRRMKYANLGDIIEGARVPLEECGLCVSQPLIILASEKHALQTIVMHESGEWLRSEFLINRTDLPPQELGTLLTYYRRYMFCSILRIATEDDDGSSSQKTLTSKDEKKDPVLSAKQRQSDVLSRNKALYEMQNLLQQQKKDTSKLREFVKVIADKYSITTEELSRSATDSRESFAKKYQYFVDSFPERSEIQSAV